MLQIAYLTFNKVSCGMTNRFKLVNHPRASANRSQNDDNRKEYNIID